MPRFRAELYVGRSLIIGQVHGTYAEARDGRLVGRLYADPDVPLGELAAIGGLALCFGREGLQPIVLAGEAVRTRDGQSAEFASLRDGPACIPREA